MSTVELFRHLSTLRNDDMLPSNNVLVLLTKQNVIGCAVVLALC